MRHTSWLLALLCTACLPFSAVDPSHVGPAPLGDDGPYGAVVLHETMRLGAEGTRRVTLILPYNTAGDVGSLPEAVPGIVLVQGGLVQRDRYVWLAQHLATRGIAVIIPEYTGWLAFFEPAVAPAAADHLAARLDRATRAFMVMGHSLGGVAAVSAALKDTRFTGLALLASQAADGDDVENWRRPMLSVAGTADESQSLEASRTSWERFGGPAFFATVEGLTHFSWTSPGRDPTVLRENEAPPEDLDLVRSRALYVLDAFVESTLRGDGNAASALRNVPRPPAGVTLEAR